MADAETIASSGFPLGFKTRNGSQRPGVILGASGRDIFKVEARHLSGSHQKEAVVTEGEHGSSWRMVSDEGVHIKGDDLAPDRKSTRLNSSHIPLSRMPSSA